MSSNKEVVLNGIRWPAGASILVDSGGNEITGFAGAANTPVTLLSAAIDTTPGTPVALSGSSFTVDVDGPNSGTWSATVALYFKNKNEVGVSLNYLKITSLNQTDYRATTNYMPGPYAYVYAVLESITGSIPADPGITVILSQG